MYLPYPSESRITEKVDSNLEYAEKVKYWANIGAGAFSSDTFNIFVSHLFMVGSKTRDGEVKVGDILAVPENYLPKADYTALGHIHTPQKLAGSAYYSGSISALSVGQKGFGVNIIETNGNKLTEIKTIQLQNLAKYEKVEVNSLDEAEQKLLGFDNTDIVELVVHQNEPISSNELKSLKKAFSCISSIALIRNNSKVQSKEKQNRKLLSDEELFKNFYKDARGFEANNDIVKMFNLCIGEEDETN